MTIDTSVDALERVRLLEAIRGRRIVHVGNALGGTFCGESSRTWLVEFGSIAGVTCKRCSKRYRAIQEAMQP